MTRDLLNFLMHARRWLVPTPGAVIALGGFMFVSTLFRTPSLEIAKSRCEKPRLLDELTGAPIVRGAGFQHPEREAFKRVDVLLAPPQVVIEPDHFRDQTWPDAKRRFNAASHDGPACHAQEDLALLARELVSRRR